MSGQPRVRSTNSADREARPVLGPAGNKLHRKPTTKQVKKPEKPAMEEETAESKEKNKIAKSISPASLKTTLSQFPPPSPSILRRNVVSMSASCSSEASSSCESSPVSVASTSSGKKVARRNGSVTAAAAAAAGTRGEQTADKAVVTGEFFSDGQKRCAWITPNADPSYVAFHDEEWGVPVHDDQKLYELLCLSGALAELSWSDILNKRQTFREVFMEFDPVAVSELNDKKVTAPGSAAASLLSELKLRSIVENARQVRKIILEFGSFDKYIWSFVNHKPILSQFRYARQVPVKTSKAEYISKDLVRRGFRSVSPTVIYSFMQVVGLTNDHLISCFRHQECIAKPDATAKDEGKKISSVN